MVLYYSPLPPWRVTAVQLTLWFVVICVLLTTADPYVLFFFLSQIGDSCTPKCGQTRTVHSLYDRGVGLKTLWSRRNARYEINTWSTANQSVVLVSSGRNIVLFVGPVRGGSVRLLVYDVETPYHDLIRVCTSII